MATQTSCKRKTMQMRPLVWPLISSSVGYCLTRTIIHPNGQLSSWSHNYILEERLTQKTQMVLSLGVLFFPCLLLSFCSQKTLDVLFPILNPRYHNSGVVKRCSFFSLCVLELILSLDGCSNVNGLTRISVTFLLP